MALVERIGLGLAAATFAAAVGALAVSAGCDGARALREQHCNSLARTEARVEAAQRGEDEARAGREGQQACIHGPQAAGNREKGA